MSELMNKNYKPEEAIAERYELVVERIGQIAEESLDNKAFEAYFRAQAKFLLLVEENRRFLADGGFEKASLEELGERNRALYEDIEEKYAESYGNPDVTDRNLGGELGKLLCCLHKELLALIPYCYGGEIEEMLIRMELFVEIYGAFETAMQETGALPEAETVRGIFYWFISDYSDQELAKTIRRTVIPGESHSSTILENADLQDLRYLYAYGLPVGENELETARFLNGLPQETIDLMADTYTEGYRIGFELANKDLGKKKTVHLLYPIGFERMMKSAVKNFDKLGLRPVGPDMSYSIFSKILTIVGSMSYVASPNKHFAFDHMNDLALFWDKALVERLLEVAKTAWEEVKEDGYLYAGPAVVEVFGEKDFEPANKPGAAKMTDEQNTLWVDYRTRYRQTQRGYILENERSFTIIAFPIPEIKEALPEATEACYAKFFEEVIRINTLNYEIYRDVQATLINSLDLAEYCEIKGMNGNRTDLKVMLHRLADPAKETIFENCVADVNIPVGEVFTSPVLEGTNGVLHVSRVFLNGLEYKDLSVTFKDGMISAYDCKNFESEQENLDFIKENILFRHKSLPLGEFAIGTNTTAYVAARKYGVQSKLPILIAEKTGPHFAVGDTCYSNSEEVRVYNPDGKEIVAKDNSVSRLRDTEPDKAYFNCHTDITIPYDELGELTAVTSTGDRIPIIRNGRFVLPGTDILNKPLDEN